MRTAIQGHMEVCRLLFEHGAKSNLIVQVRVGQPGDLLLQYIARHGMRGRFIIFFSSLIGGRNRRRNSIDEGCN